MHPLYWDYNCFQRGFDDLNQTRIWMEAEACREVFKNAQLNALRLVWSFMHQDETLWCPIEERKTEVLRLASLCRIQVGPEPAIQRQADLLMQRKRLGLKDAIHLAAALFVRADFFLTCDDDLLKMARPLDIEIGIENPVDYVLYEVGG